MADTDDIGLNFLPPDQSVPGLSAQEKVLRDRFVKEYMVDYNPERAALRIGYNKNYAEYYATQFMNEPYVLQRIADMRMAPAINDKEEAEQTKRRIREALIREAHNYGPGSSHAARVAALSQLKSIYGMDAPKQTVNTNIHKGGVMMVPGVSSLETWEQVAAESQDELRRETQH